MDGIGEILDEMWEKLELFELKKKSNLIFYGVRGETRETQSDLIHKITNSRHQEGAGEVLEGREAAEPRGEGGDEV